MIRGFVISTALVVGLAGIADRGLALVAGDAVATSVERSERIGTAPEVTFRGFPFLTQAVRGRFTRVDVDARDVRADGVTFSRVQAQLRGVEVGLVDALSGDVEAVPVESGSAVVSLDYADLNEFLESRPGSPRASGSGGVLTVRSTVGIAGSGSIEVEGTGTIRVTTTGIVVRVSGVRAVGGPAPPASVAATASGRLGFTVPTANLPFGIVLQEVAVTDRGLQVSALAKGIVVPVR